MKYLYSVIFVFLFLGVSYGQVRHVKGIRCVEAGVGISKYGLLSYAAYVNYFSGKVYGKYALFFERGDDLGLRYTSMGIDASASYTLTPVKEFLYFNLRAGGTASLDQLRPAMIVYNSDETPRRENYSTLKFGVFVGMESELFFSDRIVLVFGANQRYMFKDEFGRVRFFVSLGVRYNF